MHPDNTHINYIEFFATDLAKVKQFYSKCFGWEFVDYGPKYTAFSSSGVEGGFEQTTDPIIRGGALIVLHHDDLKQIHSIIEENGGKVVVPLFSFPGGSRFQFLDPSGNELAVWCKSEEE